jgi:hypothetical protein
VTFAAPTPSSIARMDSPPSSWARQISEEPALRMRLTTNPGTSAQVIGFLRIAWAKVTAACIVSAEVSSPRMTSMSGMTEAG